QSDDGIRDFHVSGVQTCALPISNCARAQEFVIPSQARIILLEETNAYRADHDLPPLRLSPTTSKVATDYAKYPAETDKVGHRAEIGRASCRERKEMPGWGASVT